MGNFVIHKPEKEVISVRIDKRTLMKVDVMAENANISRNELINQMIEYAIANMESDSEK